MLPISVNCTIGGLAGVNYGTIINSYTTGVIVTHETGEGVGGLVGETKGAITNSYSTVDVMGGDWGVGGLVGSCYDGYIENSYSTGNVSGTGNNVGGLVGENYINITNSYSTGSVSGVSDYVGGLVGYNNRANITNSYSTGSVSGVSDYVGGLLGYNEQSTITNSYSAGSVSGSGGFVGGLVGKIITTNMINSYYNTDTSGQSDNDGRGAPRTTLEMTYPYDTTSTTTYVGWDFVDTWHSDINGNVNNGYPVNYTYIDSVGPVITILGSNPISIYIGDTYTDSGATAIDSVDGDITNDIVATSNVDINTVGQYTVTYNVLDTAGNPATSVIRVVNVINRPGGGMPMYMLNMMNQQNQSNQNNDPESSNTQSGITSWTTGKWVKTADRSTVYFVDTNNIRHAYPNHNIWKSYFNNDFSFVTTISKEELASYQLDRNVPYNINSLFKIPSIPKVYRVGNNRSISWIKTEELVKTLYGDNWNTLVHDLPDALFGDYVLEEDTDNDGLNDSDEEIYQTDKNNKDTDGDTYLDGEEIIYKYDPLKASSDKL